MTSDLPNTAGRTAVLAGASGAVGSALVPRLLAGSSGYDRVVLLSRRPSGLDQDVRVQEHLLDFSCLADLQAALGEDVSPGNWDLFCALGTTRKKAGSLAAFRAVDLDIPVRLGRWAKEAGVGAFVVVSSLGAATGSSSDYLQCKGEMETQLQSLHLPSLTLVRPSLLAAKRAESRPGETLGHWLLLALQPLLLGPLRKYRPISVTQVAKAMLVLAQAQKKGDQIVESDRLQHLAT